MSKRSSRIFKKILAVVTAVILIISLILFADGGHSARGGARVTRSSNSQVRIFVVGDSISAGCGNNPPTTWCGPFDEILTTNQIPHVIGAYAIPGWSCQTLWSQGFRDSVVAFQPDLVVMNCGTNDVPNSQATKDAMGTAWRSMVEYVKTHTGAMILPALIQYSNPEIQDRYGRSWLIPGEKNANDVMYFNWQYYPSWFAGVVDLQRVPGDYSYLNDGSDGIHPNAFGEKVYAAIFYRAVRGYYGWPDNVDEPCGMFGHWRDYGVPPAGWIKCSRAMS